jgi:putative ABC transport system permease protein
MLRDLRTACRDLLKNPWFSGITVLTLALGIGANTAIFSVVNRVLLNPLPYPDSGSIVHLRLGSSRLKYGYPTPPLLARIWRDEARSLDGIEAFELHDVLAFDDRGARVLHGVKVTPGLAAFLRVGPRLGRALTVEDAQPGSPPVAVLSYEVWQRDYGGGANVLGRSITLDDVAHVVVGVMPPHADAIMSATGMDVWLPLSLESAPAPGFSFVEVVGRLKREVPVGQVTKELDHLLGRVRESASQNLLGPDAASRVMTPAELFGNASARDTLFVLFGAVTLLLLVACANVANLLLARGAARVRGLALRAALGASTWRLVRGLLAECLVLAAAAGITGIAIGWLTLTVLGRLRPGNLDALADVHLDPLVLGFTLLLSVITALLFGSAPAFQLVSTKVGDALRHGATGVVRGGGARLRKLLVVAQMAISVVLLVAAGLLVRSVFYLQHIDVGFDTRNLFSIQLALPRARYETPASRDLVSEQLLERIRSLPGVTGATQAFVAPQNYVQGTDASFEIRGVKSSAADADAAYGFNFVREDYFRALGVRLVEGRTFTADELRTGAALVVNRAAAQRFWDQGSAVGGEVKSRGQWATVVGVVENAVAGGLLRPRDAPVFYYPFHSERVPTFIGATPGILFLVRTGPDTASTIGSIRAAVRALDPEIAIRNVLGTDTALAGTIDGPRFNMALLAAFALIALVLAAVGLAAVIGYEIGERTREIGIRVALGARSASVRRFAMRHGLVPATAGLICGVVGAFAAARLAASMLHGVAPRDPPTFLAVVGLLLLVALAASWLAARNATRVDPVTALRSE